MMFLVAGLISCAIGGGALFVVWRSRPGTLSTPAATPPDSPAAKAKWSDTHEYGDGTKYE